MNKKWITDGPETKQLEKLFREGKLNANTKPSEAQKKYPVFYIIDFMVFLVQSFATSSNAHDGNFTLMDLITQQENKAERDDVNDSSMEPSEKKPRMETSKAIAFIQAPIIPVVFTDPETKREKCLVVIMSFNGVKGLNVDVVNKGKSNEQTLVVTYNWPEEMYNVKDMFLRDADKEMLVEGHHPKLLAVDQALRNYRENIEDAPVATIEVKLPVEVCTDPKSWHFQHNKKEGGNVIIFIELDCVRQEYVIC